MQPGELIWFLVGIGTGISVALLGFIAMAVVDGQRLRREAAGAEDEPLRTVDVLPDVPPEPAPVPRRRPAVAELRNTAAPGGAVDEMMSTLAAEIARMQSGDGASVTMDYPAGSPVEAKIAAPIEEVRAEPAPVAVSPAAETEPRLTPMRAAMAKAMAQPAASVRRPIAPRVTLPSTPAAPVAPLAASPPEITAPVDGAAEPPKPVVPDLAPEPLAFRTEAKTPPLPRVAPARKFAPALPPRGPNRPTPKPH